MHVYKYEAVESYFGDKYKQTFEILIDFKMKCLSGKVCIVFVPVL